MRLKEKGKSESQRNPYFSVAYILLKHKHLSFDLPFSTKRKSV